MNSHQVCHNKNLKELMRHQFFQIPSLYNLRYFQTALYFRDTFSERRTLSFSDWFKLPVRARTSASRSSFANWPVMGFLGDSIPNIIVSVLFLAAKIGIFLFIFQIFEQRNQKKFIFLSSSFIYQPSILFSQPSLTSLSPSAIAHLSLCHFLVIIDKTLTSRGFSMMLYGFSSFVKSLMLYDCSTILISSSVRP